MTGCEAKNTYLPSVLFPYSSKNHSCTVLKTIHVSPCEDSFGCTPVSRILKFYVVQIETTAHMLVRRHIILLYRWFEHFIWTQCRPHGVLEIARDMTNKLPLFQLNLSSPGNIELQAFGLQSLLIFVSSHINPLFACSLRAIRSLSEFLSSTYPDICFGLNIMVLYRYGSTEPNTLCMYIHT